MDRDKRRSKEEEEELDRKIALIREKNLKIEQRSREVEADRVRSTGEVAPKKPTQASTQPPKTGGKNKTWDREWDQGKTPAETWRENVPSIEHTGRLAGDKPQQQNKQKDQNQRNRQKKPLEQQVTKGSRLEGRVTTVAAAAVDKPAGGKGKGKREVHQNKAGDITISIKVAGETQEAPRRERQGQRHRGNSEKKPQQIQTANKDEKSEEATEKKQKSRRPRRENDKYVVKTTLMKIVDKVDKMERRRKREEGKEAQQEETIEETKVVSEKTPEEAPEVVEKEAELVNEEECVKTAETKPEAPESEVPAKEVTKDEAKEEPKDDEKTSDANQNVITLTKEKVLTVQMAS